jgi:hypothetical protein
VRFLHLALIRVCTLRSSYFRNPWNVIDFVIVVVSLTAVGLPGIGVFRAFRALRAVRIVVRSKRTQVSAGTPDLL